MNASGNLWGFSQEEKTRLVEVCFLFLGAFLFLLASNLLGNIGGFVGENAGNLGVAYLLLAPIFVGFFKAKQQDKEVFALVGDVRKAFASCLFVVVLVFPAYAVLYHGWAKFWKWTPKTVPSFLLADFDDHLRAKPKSPKGLALWLEGQSIFLVNFGNKPAQVRLDGCSGEAIILTMTSDGEIKALRKTRSGEPVTLYLDKGEGISCDLSGSDHFSATTNPSDGGFYVGASSKPQGANVSEQRSLSWLLDFLLLQFLAVAFPEEFFFRGYIQTRLKPLFKKRWRVLGFDMGYEILLASLLFALVHLAGGFSFARLAVFFPGLLFGFLREYTNGIAAPTIIHALSNCLLRLLQRWHGF